MAANLPDGISRDHLLAAIRQFDNGVAHRFADSTGYDVLFEGRRYPPKAIVGLAARLLTGDDLGPEDFSGGRWRRTTSPAGRRWQTSCSSARTATG